MCWIRKGVCLGYAFAILFATGYINEKGNKNTFRKHLQAG